MSSSASCPGDLAELSKIGAKISINKVFYLDETKHKVYITLCPSPIYLDETKNKVHKIIYLCPTDFKYLILLNKIFNKTFFLSETVFFKKNPTR